MPLSRDHGLWPRVTDAAAMSQDSQKAPHTTANTSSTACIVSQGHTPTGTATASPTSAERPRARSVAQQRVDLVYTLSVCSQV